MCSSDLGQHCEVSARGRVDRPVSLGTDIESRHGLEGVLRRDSQPNSAIGEPGRGREPVTQIRRLITCSQRLSRRIVTLAAGANDKSKSSSENSESTCRHRTGVVYLEPVVSETRLEIHPGGSTRYLAHGMTTHASIGPVDRTFP